MIVGIGRERHRAVERDVAHADRIEVERLARDMLHRVDVDLIFFLRNRRRNGGRAQLQPIRSEEHTSELQSLMRISYAVFCLKKKKKYTTITKHIKNKT